jgi:histidinol-phosphate aminotransferase
VTTTPSPSWIHSLAPYQPGKPASELERELGIHEIVKLASNENPGGPSPLAVEAMQRAVTDVRLYPDPSAHELRTAIAARHGVGLERVVVGNGSNAIITNLVRAFCAPGESVVSSEFGFVAYRIVASAAGVESILAAETSLRTDVRAVAAACRPDTRIVFIANPNNPTGTWNRRDELEWLCDNVPPETLLVIDEAYFEYAIHAGVPDATELFGRRENLAVMRTFSKAYGLAGCRVGYLVGPAYVAERLLRIREPFDVNHVAQAGALAALADEQFIADTVGRNATERDRLEAGLRALGCETWASAGNFVLFRTSLDGKLLFERLLRDGVIVRPVGAYGLPRHVRVTVGTDSQNQRFLSALAGALAESPDTNVRSS